MTLARMVSAMPEQDPYLRFEGEQVVHRVEDGESTVCGRTLAEETVFSTTRFDPDFNPACDTCFTGGP